MMLYFHRQIYFAFVTTVAITSCMVVYQVEDKFHNSDFPNVPVIVWWTPFGSDGKLRKCGIWQCYFTSNRSYQYHENIKSILFYGSNFRVDDLPKWKSNETPWGLLHEESPRNNPILVQQKALSLFTYSSTFSRFSDVPLTLVDLPSVTELLSRKYFVPTKEKTKLTHTKHLAPLLYIQTDCDTASNRDLYVADLMKYIRIDSYGTCLNNAQLNGRLKKNYLEVLNNEDFLSFVANYKFTLAFENAVCYDYITEKLWRPLMVGSIPVYYGSPSFKDWLPSNKSAISVLDFKDPKSLADFLHELSNNETEYNKYLSHKIVDNYEIENHRLKEALENKRIWNHKTFGDYVEEFECFVCESAHATKDPKPIDTKHYDCPFPVNPLTYKTDYNNWWTKQWILEKCAAKILAYYLQNNLTVNIENFENDKIKLYHNNQC